MADFKVISQILHKFALACEMGVPLVTRELRFPAKMHPPKDLQLLLILQHVELTTCSSIPL